MVFLNYWKVGTFNTVAIYVYPDRKFVYPRWVSKMGKENINFIFFFQNHAKKIVVFYIDFNREFSNFYTFMFSNLSWYTEWP